MTWRINRLTGKGRMEKDDVNPSVFEEIREKRGLKKNGHTSLKLRGDDKRQGELVHF